MYTKDIGEHIKKLRKLRGMSRSELSERVGISQSHLEKIENGLRNPGMSTYKKIMKTLNEDQTIQEKCIVHMQEILMRSSEEKAVYLTRVLECMSENLDMIIS